MNAFDKKWWQVEVLNWPISQLYSFYKDGLDMNPPYQRGLVWDYGHKVRLINSLATGLGVSIVRGISLGDAIEIYERINFNGVPHEAIK